MAGAATNGNGHGRFFDLDAARVARLEAKGDAPTIRWGGETFTLPVEMPVEFAYVLDDAKTAMQLVFGDQFDRFWGHRPAPEDIQELLGALSGMYGMGGGVPESTASGGSSTTNGKPSRPTSRGTTTSTSAKRASGRTR